MACDLVSLGDDEMARIREAVEEISGVPGERVSGVELAHPIRSAHLALWWLNSLVARTTKCC